MEGSVFEDHSFAFTVNVNGLCLTVSPFMFSLYQQCYLLSSLAVYKVGQKTRFILIFFLVTITAGEPHVEEACC